MNKTLVIEKDLKKDRIKNKRVLNNLPGASVEAVFGNTSPAGTPKIDFELFNYFKINKTKKIKKRTKKDNKE